jgi:hypothetical protein
MRRAALALILGFLAAPVQGLDGPEAPPPEGARRVGRLQGSASLGRNRGVVGATVVVRPAGEGGHLRVTASDARGQFRVDGLLDGDYRVELRREGLATVVKEGVGLRFPARAVIEVLMQPAAAPPESRAAPSSAAVSGTAQVVVTGTVTARDGGTLADVPVRLVRPDGLADPWVARSGEDGSFALGPLSPGTWRFEARVVGFLPIRTPLDLGMDTRLDVSMVRQPAGYDPTPLELMPPERPVPPQHPLGPPPPPPAETVPAPPPGGDPPVEPAAPGQ